jgi:ankyrin repeat protein
MMNDDKWAIYNAARSCELEEVRKVINKHNVDTVLIPITGAWCPTALAIVAQASNQPVNHIGSYDPDVTMSYLLSLGADPNIKITGDKHILTISAQVYGVDRTRLLLDAGANINAHDNDKYTALEAAIRYRNVDTVKLLIDRGADIKSLLDSPSIHRLPKYARRFVKARNYVRRISIIVLGLRKFKYTTLNINNRDVIRLIAKHIWSSRTKET